jgi:hypothetical protein
MPDLKYSAIGAAMAKFENVNPDYHNPGGVSYGTYALQHGAVGSTHNGIAIFPSLEAGQTAQDALIASYASKGATISGMISEWSPVSAKGNSAEKTQNYINSVASDLGVSADTPVSKLQGAVDDLKKQLEDQGINVPEDGETSSAVGTVASFFGLELGRVVAIVLGLICIAAGLMMFKPVRETVITTAKTAATAAKAAAVAA